MATMSNNVIVGVDADTGSFSVRLTWADGSTSVARFDHLAGKGVFAPLADPEFFGKVVVGPRGRSLEWPDEIDFCADALWFDAHPEDNPAYPLCERIGRRRPLRGDCVMHDDIVIIQNDADLAEAQALVARLGTSDDPADVARLRAQALILAAYEAEHWPLRRIGAAAGGAFDWLAEEPDLYTDADLVERYRA